MGQSSLLSKNFYICHETIVRYATQGVRQLGICVTEGKESGWALDTGAISYARDSSCLRIHMGCMVVLMMWTLFHCGFFVQGRGCRHLDRRRAGRKEGGRQPFSYREIQTGDYIASRLEAQKSIAIQKHDAVSCPTHPRWSEYPPHFLMYFYPPCM